MTKVGDATDRLSDLVRSTDWGDLTPRLLAYASFALARISSGTRSRRTPHDYVVRAVLEVLENSDRYAQIAPKSMFRLLAGVISQLIAANGHPQQDSTDVEVHSAEEVRAHLRREGIVPNATIRVVWALGDAWLSTNAYPAGKAFSATSNNPKRYRLRAVSLGSVRPGINLDKALALADALEDEQLVNKIEQRK